MFFLRKMAIRLLRLFRLRTRDPWDTHYAAERALYQHTLTDRPWLQSKPPCVLQKDELDVIEFDLLRYIHSIDKGLLLDNRRPGFGVKKIRCVINMLRYMKLCNDADVHVMGWTIDILRRYVRVLSSDIALADPGKEQTRDLISFAEELNQAMLEFEKYDSFEPDTPACTSIPPILFSRRSVRSWDSKLVDDATLHTLVEAAAWAPASCNRQPYRFLFLRDPEKKKMAIEAAIGGKGFADKAPVIVVLLNDVRAYYAPHERHLAYVDTALAAQNFSLAAHSMGLGTVFLSMAVEDTQMETQFRNALNIPDWYASIALIALGYPKDVGECGIPVRRSIDKMMVFDEFNNSESDDR